MKKNVGSTDKLIRILMGLIIGLLGIYYQSWLGLIGVVPVLTAFIGFCPAYAPFGISTCKKTDS